MDNTETSLAKILLASLQDKQPELFEELNDAGGLRALFDQFCPEWHDIEMDDKLDILDKMQLAGFDIHEIALAAGETMVAAGAAKGDAFATIMATYATLLKGALDDRAA